MNISVRLVIFYMFHHGSLASVRRAHHSHSLSYPVPSCHTDYRKSFFPQHNQGLERPCWGCGCCTHPWVFLITSSNMYHSPQSRHLPHWWVVLMIAWTVSVRDSWSWSLRCLHVTSRSLALCSVCTSGCYGSWIGLVRDVKCWWDTQNYWNLCL